MPLVLDPIQSGYNLSKINDNFQRIEDTWDEKLDRVNSGSFYNQMDQALDMNSNEIINTKVSDDPTSLVTKEYVDALFNAIDGAEGIVPIIENRQQGDGVTTLFNSPATEQAPAASFFIQIDGITQRPITDFNATSAGKIQFNEAPPLLSDVDITWFEPASLGDVVTLDQFPTLTNYRAENVADMLAGNPATMKVGDTCLTGGTLWKRISNTNNTIVDYSPLTPILINDFGSGQSDIQEALNLGGDLIIKPGVYNIDPNIGLDFVSNTKLLCPNWAVFQASTSATSGTYQMLRAWDVKDIEIEGIHIIGDRSIHTGSTGEHGHGLSTNDVDGLRLTRFKSDDCWGDGIYLGSSSVPTTPGDVTNKNVKMLNVACDNNRRQGLSVISVDGLNITNLCEFNNTNGTTPAAGIDLEPNYAHNVLWNVDMTGVHTRGNAGDGILVYLNNLANTDVSIAIRGHTSIEDRNDASFSSPTSPCGGYLSYSDYTCISPTRGGIVTTWGEAGVNLLIDNGTNHNLNTSGTGATNARCAINVRDTGTNIRNLSITDVKNDGAGNDPYDVFIEAPTRLLGCTVNGLNWRRVTGVSQVDMSANFFDIPNDTLFRGLSDFPGSPTGEQTLSPVSHQNYITTEADKHVSLILPSASGDSPAYVFLDDVSTLNGNYDMYISAPAGQTIGPVGNRHVGFSYADRSRGGYIKFKRTNGRWNIISNNLPVQGI